MMCKDCADCFWFNNEETSKTVSNCEDYSQVCIPVPKAFLMAVARDIAYGHNVAHRQNPRFMGVRALTAVDISHALVKIYGNKRKHVPMKAIEKVMNRINKSSG